MKLGEQAHKGYWDVRTAATFGKLVRVYGDGMERMARLQGKLEPRTVNQTIKVVYVDNRDQGSVHIDGGVQSCWRTTPRNRWKRGYSAPRAAKPRRVQAVSADRRQ